MVQNLPFCPKNGGFSLFFTNCALEFPNFCMKPSLSSQKNITALVFQGNLKNGPFWPILTQIWPKFGHLAHWNRLAKKFLSKILKIFFKNIYFRTQLFFKNLKNIFRRRKSRFYPSNAPFDLPLLALKKNFEIL